MYQVFPLVLLCLYLSISSFPYLVVYYLVFMVYKKFRKLSNLCVNINIVIVWTSLSSFENLLFMWRKYALEENNKGFICLFHLVHNKFNTML
jgi:hypothetical protein